MYKDYFKLLLVDDEEAMRNELQNIMWDTLGVSLVGVATNGKEALTFCQNNPVDIVVSDIEMPIMDGLEFAEIISEELPHIQLIFLTCHDEFAYAQAGLRLGVVDYVLKTLLDEEDMRKPIAKARKARTQYTMAQLRAKEEKRWELEALANSSYIQKNIPEAMYQNFSVPSYYTILSHTKPMYASYISSSVYYLLEKTLGLTCIRYSLNKYLICFYKTTQEIATLTDSLLLSLENQLKMIDVIENAEIDFYIAKPQKVEEYSEILTLFTYEEDYDNLFFYTQDCLLDNSMFTTADNDLVLSDLTKQFGSAFVPESILAYCLQNGISRQLLKSTVIASYANKVENVDDFVQKISESETFTELSECLSYFFTEKKTPAKRQEVFDAIKIIEKEYASPLTIANIAERLNISANYLGRIFNEQEGKSLLVFLNEYRVKKAVELIQLTNHKIYKISEQVGFPSYRYFTIVFKKITNKTPSDYRVY